MQRRVPTQARSRKRYEAILDAAASLFAEIGYEGTTTEAVAQRAETSIGSLYQFFPNKKAVYLAMAERLMKREEALLERVAMENMGKPWDELLDVVFDAFVELVDEPAWRALWATNISLIAEVAAMGERYHLRIVERTQLLIAHYAPELDPKRNRVVAITMVEAIGAMLLAASRYPTKVRRAVQEESKRMVLLYARDIVRP